MSEALFVGPSDELIEKTLKPTARVRNAKGYKSERGNYNQFRAWQGGLYDPAIFGTKYKCYCGNQVTSGKCKLCGDIVVTKMSDWENLAGYYKLSVPYVSTVRYKKFFNEVGQHLKLYKIFEPAYGLDIVQRVWTMEFTKVETTEDKAIVSKDGKFYNIEVTDAQEDSNIFHCGLFGLYGIISNFDGVGYDIKELLHYINYDVVIAPVYMRPMSIGFDGYPTYPQLTSDYAFLITMSTLADELIYKNSPDNITLADKLAIAASINQMVLNIESTYAALQSSKENDFRYAGTSRISHSGRSNIISALTPVNTVLLPWSLAYESLKDDIIERLNSQYGRSGRSIKLMYDSASDEAKQILEEIVNDCVVVINRAPTLHRWSMLAFKAKLWSDEESIGMSKDKVLCIGLNTTICSGFNADFDGDQMAYYIFTRSPDKEKVYEKMCIENNWFYEKNASPVFVPVGTVLSGLYYGTQYNPPSDESTIESYDTYEDLAEAYKFGIVEFDTVVKIGEIPTTYAIESINRVLGRPLWRVLGYDNIAKSTINSKNIAALSAYIGKLDNKADVLTQIFYLGNEFHEHHGTRVFNLDELFQMEPDFPEIGEILTSDKPEKQKYIELCSRMKDIVTANIKKLMPTLAEQIDSNSMKLKIASLVSIFSPVVKFEGGKVTVDDQSLNTGYDTENMVHHLSTNREILRMKADLVPKGGFVTRQVEDLERDYIYKPGLTSTDVIGIEVLKKDAYGRVQMDGTPVGKPISVPDGESLVRIKSSIYTPNNGIDKFYIKSDELNQELYITTENSAIGASVATSTTEAITQAQLALKHGGALLQPSTEGIKLDSDGVIVELASTFFTVRTGEGELTYPVPKDHFYTKEALDGKVKKGQYVYYKDEMIYVDYNIKRIVDVIGARKFSDNDPLSKPYDGVECYTIKGGRIKYDFKKGIFSIGSKVYYINDELVYYFPDGAVLKPYDKFCSGSLNPRIINRMTASYEQKFNLFYRQMKLLIPDIQLLSIELLFRSLFNFGGTGTILSAIRKIDPVISLGHEKPTKILEGLLGVPIADTLAAAIMLHRNNRSILN